MHRHSRGYYIVAIIGLTITCGAREPKPRVVYTSECSCEGEHSESRWTAKIDPALPPSDRTQISSITPSAIYAWSGPGMSISRKQDRIAAEQRWYSLSGRVRDIRAEEDGDLHILLEDADGKAEGLVVAEVPLAQPWCEIRKQVFSWLDAHFPFDTRRGATFTVAKRVTVTVVGKAFYDVNHAGKDTSNNKRNYDASLAVWEIHPVMQLQVGDVLLSADTRSQIATPAQPNNVSPTATPAVSSQVGTVVRPVKIKIRYGETVLPAGMKLKVLSRDDQSIRADYMGEVLTIPLSAVDIR